MTTRKRKDWRSRIYDSLFPTNVPRNLQRKSLRSNFPVFLFIIFNLKLEWDVCSFFSPEIQFSNIIKIRFITITAYTRIYVYTIDWRRNAGFSSTRVTRIEKGWELLRKNNTVKNNRVWKIQEFSIIVRAFVYKRVTFKNPSAKRRAKKKKNIPLLKITKKEKFLTKSIISRDVRESFAFSYATQFFTPYRMKWEKNSSVPTNGNTTADID